MPAFTLYGSRGSTNTDRVRLALAEGGFTDYDFVLINLHKGEQKVRDLLLLQEYAASPCVRKLNILLSPKISSHSSNIRALTCNSRLKLTPLPPVQRTQKTPPVG
jgi:hypothetical protein